MLLLFAFLQDPLIEKLSSDNIAERAEAELRIKELGSTASERLREAARSGDRELALRAQQLLRAIELKATLPPALLLAFPGVEDRLARSPGEWTTLLLAAVKRVRERAPADPIVLVPADLDPIVPYALRGARHEEEIRELTQAIYELRLKGAEPAIRELLRGPRRAATAQSLEWIKGDFSLELLPLLRDPSTAQIAAKGLGSSGWRVLPDIVELLTHEHPVVRASAAHLLGALRYHGARPALRGLLNDPDNGPRHVALHVLRDLGDRESLSDMLALARDPDPSLRHTAAFAAVDGDEPAVLRAIVDWIENPDPETITQAVPAAGRWKVKAAVPGLLKLVSARDDETGRAAAYALGHVGDSAAVDPLRELLRHAAPRIRVSAVEGLNSLRAHAALPELEKLLADPDPPVRRVAAEAVLALGGRARLPVLFPLLRDPDEGPRGVAIDALREFGTRKEAEALLPLLKDPRHARQAQWAVLALKPEGTVDALLDRLGEPGAHLSYDLSFFDLSGKLPGIRALLDSTDPNKREAAASLLGWAKDVESIPRLRQTIEDKVPSVRTASANALIRLKAEGALEIVRKLLDDPDARPRLTWALGDAGPEALTLLEKLAVDPDPHLRARPVIESLARAGGKEAITILLRMLGDPADDVRSMALITLGKLDPAGALKRLDALEHREWRWFALYAAQNGNGDILPELLRRSRKTRPEDRAGVIDAIARAKLTNLREELREALNDPEPAVAGAAAEALAAIGDADSLPTLRPFLRHPCALLRERAARALCRFGEKDGARVLIDERGRNRFVLNRVAQPAQWNRLAETPFPKGLGGATTRKRFELLAERLMIPLEIRISEHDHDDHWPEDGSVLDALAACERVDILFDGRGLRVLNAEAGYDAWRRWRIAGP